MRRWQPYLIITLIVALVLAYMATYTVRFTESAVVTTLGRADDDSVHRDPGLRPKIPFVQRVTKYDTRTRLLRSRGEQMQTADNRQVVVTAFLTWRVSDPLKFYRRFGAGGDRSAEHYRQAETMLHGQLRNAMSQISKYRLRELLSAQAGGSKLPDLERDILALLRGTGEGASMLAEIGIEPVAVGVSGLKLPEGTSQEVFNSMKKYRERLATELTTQGQSIADSIRNRAEQDSRTIIAFAEKLAADIRGRGDAEATQYLAQMNENPRLAIFLQEVQFMRQVSSRRGITLVLSTAMPGLGLLRPDALNGLSPGEIPATSFDHLNAPREGGGIVPTAAPGAAQDRPARHDGSPNR